MVLKQGAFHEAENPAVQINIFQPHDMSDIFGLAKGPPRSILVRGFASGTADRNRAFGIILYGDVFQGDIA
jgi:hypothetical protein